MTSKEHWETVYATRAATDVSWFQPHAERSLQLMRDAGVPKSAAIIDVGGGASTLVDDLLADGFEDVTVIDIADAALATSRARLGAACDRARWIAANVLEYAFAREAYDVWHDRAAFHFLTRVDDRRAYVQAAHRAVRPGGHAIVATFAEDGPTRCSGLPVMRYDAAALSAEFRPYFAPTRSAREIHRTPAGTAQSFVYCTLRRQD